MPIYEYQCQLCRRVHEVWQKITDNPIIVCPDCSGPMHKLVSLSSFKLKGSGWYVDGYTSKPQKKDTGQEKKDIGHQSKSPSTVDGAKIQPGPEKSQSTSVSS